MKSVLRSVKPYWFYIICKGKIKVEVDKIAPRSEEWDNIVYLYCSKDKKSFNSIPEEYREKYRKYLGTVGAKYVCEVEKFGSFGLHGWHISDLKIYDKPRELGEFKTPDKPYHEIIERDGTLMFTDGYESGKPLKRAPQSWQYVEEF